MTKLYTNTSPSVKNKKTSVQALVFSLHLLDGSQRVAASRFTCKLTCQVYRSGHVNRRQFTCFSRNLTDHLQIRDTPGGVVKYFRTKKFFKKF